MAVTTPGIDFIALLLAIISVPSFLVALSLQALRTTYGYIIPTWLVVSGFIFFVPFVSIVSIVYKNWGDKRRAAALGARLARVIHGKSMGNVDLLLKMRRCMQTGYPLDEFVEISGENGPIVNMRFLWLDMIFTYSPEHTKIILATDFSNYVKGKRFFKTVFSLMGSGIFSSDGNIWKYHRSMIRPFFARDRISDFEIFDRHANTAIALVKERMRGGFAVDFQDMMSRFTIDAASEFLFGHCVHNLATGLPYPHNASNIAPKPQDTHRHRDDEFCRALFEAQQVISLRERSGPVWPLAEIFRDKAREPMRIVHAFLDPFIKEAIAKTKITPNSKDESHLEDKETLIDNLVQSSSDPTFLRDQVLNLIIAGRDTTSVTLTFIFYFLAMHPAVNVRLREEILTKVGPISRPSYDDIAQMKYLRAVINETLRLFPIVPLNTRECVKATVWPSPDPTQKPIYIPAGTKVAYSVFLLHRRKDLWGPDAEDFDPDRFLDDRLKTYLLKNSSIFQPFSAGPRICPGQQFAYNEISFMVIRLLQQFSSISLDSEASPPEARPPTHWTSGVGRKAIEKMYPMTHFTLYIKGGLWVKMKEAENNE